MRLTVSTVKLDRVGRQMDGDAVLVGLWEVEILDLAVRAEHVHIQDCDSADNKVFGGTGEKDTGHFYVTSRLEGVQTKTVAHTDVSALGLTFPHKPKC